MYPVTPPKAAPSAQPKRWSPLGLGGTVWALGWTSCLTDISAEMITCILPLYLVGQLHLSPALLGAIDGVNQGGAALVRLLGGWWSDRLQRYKWVAAFGYACSALSKAGLLVLGRSAPGFLGMTVLDRLGKGLRTGPRDALISLAARDQQLGNAFGLHRALDTAGALLGPLLAFGVLAVAPGAFDAVFVVSFLVALLGLGVLITFVRDPARARTEAPRLQWAELGALVRPRPLRRLVLVAGLLGVITISDGLIYLMLQRQIGFDPNALPLFYVATPLVYMLLALPVGRLSDRFGHPVVLLLGHLCMLLVYGCLLLPGGDWLAAGLAIVALGAFYAATDGVLMALSSAHFPERLRGSGLSLVATANGLGRLLASIVFGVAWEHLEVRTAVTGLLALGLLGLGLATRVLLRAPRVSGGVAQ